MRDRTSQEAWQFLNHLSATIAMECIADIARIGEDKNVSFEDLRQTLGKIMANQVNGKWTLAPSKNPSKNSSPNSISRSTHLTWMR